jgi:probable rRNA maturation factor
MVCPPFSMKAASSSKRAEKKSAPALALSTAGFIRRAQQLIGLEGEVSFLLTSNAGIRRLNRRFRGKDKVTDVLSFPASAAGIAGDIAIALPVAAAQAKRRGHNLRGEVEILALHGLLHLRGYDHECDNGRMARKEEKLRKLLGLPAALTSRAALPAKRKRSS